MAKRQVPELVKFVIDNRNAPDMAGSLKDFKSDMDAFLRTVESSANALDFFQSRLKSITTDINAPDFGLGVQEIIVQKSSEGTVESALTGKAMQMGTARQWDYNIRQVPLPVKTGTMSLVGEDAFKEARAKLQAEGGDIWRDPTAKSPDRVRYFYPYEALNTATAQEKAQKQRDIFGEARKISRAEKDYNDWEKADKEAKLQQKEENKKNIESAHRATAITKGILAVVTIATDILRRILSATLQNASKIDRQTVESRSVGITYGQRRNMDIFDKAHGLPEGATFGAISSIQNMFGDITRLDEGALGILARVMGSDVEALVKSGIGGENPDKLLEKILDKYFLQFKSGRNSLGMYVGQEQARRELITSLNSVAPEIATLFARMVDDATSGKYGNTIQGYASWRRTFETNRTGLTEADLKFASAIGTKYNEILAIVDDLKTSFFTRLGNSMDDILTKIRNIRLGVDATKSLEMDRTNYQKNETTKRQIQQSIQAYNVSASNRLNELTRQLPATPSETRFMYSAETLAGIALGTIDEKYLQKNVISGSGMLSQNKSEVKAYLARGKSVLASAMLDPEVSDEIVRIMASMEALAKIEKEQAKGIGGNVAEIDFSLSEETVQAEKKYKDLALNLRQAYKDNKIYSSTAVARLREAYAQELYDDPTLYEAMLYNLFSTDEAGIPITSNAVAIDRASKESYNVAEVGGVIGMKGRYSKKSVQKYLRGIFAKRKADYLSSTGKTRLTPEEEKALYIDIITEYNAMYYEALHRGNTSAKDKSVKYLISATEEASVQALQSADSKIISALIRSGIALPNGNYRYSGTQNPSGEYTLNIVGKDPSGKEIKQSISLGRTEGEEVIGTFEMTNSGFVFQQAK